MNRRPIRRKPRRTWNPFLWLQRLLTMMSLLVAVTAGIVVSTLYVYSTQLPSVDELSNYSPAQITKLYARDGRLISQFGSEKRLYVSLDQVSDSFKKAIIAVEDHNFYRHTGLDFYGIARALWKDIKTGRLDEGASTITQQLARNMFLTLEKTWSRKVKEALLAWRIERKCSKNEILEIYLNQMFFGSNAYGIEAAARVHFGKPASELNLPEAAMLAGVLQSPSRLSPFKDLASARERMAIVLRSMQNERVISEQERLDALQAPLNLVRSTLSDNAAPYFADYLRTSLENQFGEDLVWRGGLNVHTTLDLDMQLIAERVLVEGLANLNLKRGGKTEEAPVPVAGPMIQGGLIAIVPDTGEIVAMVGGTDYLNNQWNRTVQAKRQPGSAFKPFLFATAFSKGYTPSSIIVDEQIVLDTSNPNGPWIPKNYENEFYGPTCLTEAIIHSRNVVAVKLLREIGLDPVIELSSRCLGVGAFRFQQQKNLTMALGSVELTPLELASGFAAFANEGIRIEPHGIREVRSSGGDLMDAPKAKADVVLTPEVAYVLTDVLKKVLLYGTGKPAYLEGRPAAGKTGTTDECVSAWFAGYTPELCCAVYIAYDDKMSLGHRMTGGQVAGPIWARFMKEALAGTEPSDFQVPANVTFATIDWHTGLRATDGCSDVYRQAYVSGTEPKGECSCGSIYSMPSP